MGQIRRARRVPTSIDVQWGFDEACPYQATIIDLSIFGCGVRNREYIEVNVGQIVYIRFWMPHERILKIEVVHKGLERSKDFGAQFLDLTDDEKQTLEEMVRLFGEPLRPKHENQNSTA